MHKEVRGWVGTEVGGGSDVQPEVGYIFQQDCLE